MPDAFNPYVEWLGLPAQQREPNHYQLLGLADFEADTARITIAADKAMSKVRSFRPGPNAKAWSKLLDELLLAKAHLTDAERKSEYDAELREAAGNAASSSAPASPPANGSKSEPSARTAPDPRFPPGMGPNDGRSLSAKQPQPEVETSAAKPAVEPTVGWTSGPTAPAPLAMPAPQPAPPPQAQPLVAWPASMLHPVPQGTQAAPVAHAPQSTPATQPLYAPQQPGYPQSPMPQAPMAYPAGMPAAYQPAMPYGQPPMAQQAYGQPHAPAPYPQPPYQQPQYQQPQYSQPQYPQPGQYAQPAYGAAPYAQPQPAMPYGMPAPPQPTAHAGNYGAQGYASYPAGDPLAHMATSAPMDPMAPVALPSALPTTGDDGKQGRVVGFAAAGSQSAPATSAIPKGKAVAPAPVSKPESPLSSFADAPRSSPALSPPNTIAPRDLVAHAEPTRAEKNLLYGTIGAVVFLIGAIVFAIAYSNRGGPDDLTNNPEPAAPDPKPLPRIEPAPFKPVAPQPNPDKPPMPADTSDPFANPPMNDPTTAQKPIPPMPVTPKPDPIKPEPIKPEVMKPDPVKPDPPKPDPEPAKPKPPKPEPPKPEPPKPPEPAPEVKLTPVELATLSKSMTTARDALSERNFDEFEKQYTIANQLARSEDQKAKANRLMVLGNYVKQFDRQLKTLLADENFDAGAELVIGTGTRVVVVERDSTMIVIRINGMNKSYSLANLPAGLAIALMDKRLNADDPIRHLVKAAYFATVKVQTDDTKQKAKDLFEQGTREGADAGDLALVLTDTYDFKE